MNDKLGPEGLLLMLGMGVVLTTGLGGRSPFSGLSRRHTVKPAAVVAEEEAESTGADVVDQETEAEAQPKSVNSQRPRAENVQPVPVGMDPTRILQPIAQLNRRIQDISRVIEDVASSMSNIIEATGRLRDGSI